MSNSNNSGDTNRRVRRRLYVPLNLTNYRKNAKNININSLTNESNYTNIPREIGLFTQLERLSLSGHKLTWIPKEIGNLKNLKELYLWKNNLTSLPKEIGNLKKLEEIVLQSNSLTSLPKEIGLCKNLKKIYLNENNLTSIPKEIGNLKNLKELYLWNNNLTSIPKEIGLLKNLKELDLGDNNLTSIPKEISRCKELRLLLLNGNNLTSLPKEIEDFPRLGTLDLRRNPRLKAISSELRKPELNIWKNTNTKFINHKYYTNQLSTVTVKRKNLPRLPPKIRENIARKVNTKPKAKTEGNKMNVARSSLRAYNNNQKVLTRRYSNMLFPLLNKNFNNRVVMRSKIHNFSKTLKNISKNNKNK